MSRSGLHCHNISVSAASHLNKHQGLSHYTGKRQALFRIDKPLREFRKNTEDKEIASRALQDHLGWKTSALFWSVFVCVWNKRKFKLMECWLRRCKKRCLFRILKVSLWRHCGCFNKAWIQLKYQWMHAVRSQGVRVDPGTAYQSYSPPPPPFKIKRGTKVASQIVKSFHMIRKEGVLYHSFHHRWLTTASGGQ